MRWIVAAVLLAVTARCQELRQLVFSSDMSGHYVPLQENGTDCPLVPTSSRTPFPLTIQLDDELDLSVVDENLMEVDGMSPWGGCGKGGVPRLAGMMKELLSNSSETLAVTAGNILGDGNWELPVGIDAAVKAVSQFNVTGLGRGEFLRGAAFLQEFLEAVGKNTNTTVLACNVKSRLLNGMVKPSVVINNTLFVGVVDPDVVQDHVSFDPDIQLSNISCVDDEIQNHKEVHAVVVVGSVASLNSTVLKRPNVTAFVLSGLTEQDKEKILQDRELGLETNGIKLVTEGYGESIGVFDFTFANVTSTTLDGNVIGESDITNDMVKLQREVTDFYDTAVQSYFELTSNKCNSTECSLGDVICDAALIGSLLDGRITMQPIAVWPGQNLTGRIPKGKSTVQQLYDSLPSEQVAIANASGNTVIQLFARSVQDMTVDATASATFLQMSGVRVTYDLDLDKPYRAKYLMNLCLTCTPQEYMPVSESLNYSIVLPVSMLSHPSWSDIVSQFTGVHITGFSARDAVAAKAQTTGRLLSPVGGRIGFTHIVPDDQPEPDTFVAVLTTVLVCMGVFGLGLFGFRVWSRRQDQFGSSMQLVR